jgi:uncharacterized protein YndB with AHSA1/START domain
MNPEKHPQSNSATREITTTRIFDAPRELVFDAWTDAEQISKWWGPVGFTTTTSRMDARTGGVWEHVMRGPNGVDYKNKISYVEVTRPERIIYDHVSGPLFRSTALFEDLGGKTRLTVTMVFGSAELRDRVAKEFKAVEGLEQTLSRLADHVAADANDPEKGIMRKAAIDRKPPEELKLTRIFDAPREVVFRAWIDPLHLAQWWGPGGFTTTVKAWEPKKGGAILLNMNAPNGTVYPMGGTFVEVAHPERIAFTSCALDEKGDAIFEIMNTVSFADEGGQTRLSLHARVLSKLPGADPYLKGQKAGWTQSLDRLDAHARGKGQ